MAWQPVGPMPASTYWRRRAALLVVVLVAVLLAVKACGAAGPSPRTAALATTRTPAATASPSGSPSPTGSASTPSTPASAGSRPPSAGPTAPATAPPTGPPLCADSALTVSATSDAARYRAGAAPRFTLSVHNTAATCLRALGPGAVELQVLSGSDRIWSSNDCVTSRDQGVMTLPAGATRATTVQWPGRRSRPGCHAGGAAQPGTYRVTVRIGTLFRQVAVFDLTA